MRIVLWLLIVVAVGLIACRSVEQPIPSPSPMPQPALEEPDNWLTNGGERKVGQITSQAVRQPTPSPKPQPTPSPSPTPQPTLEELISRLTNSGREELVEDRQEFRVFWSQMSQDFLVIVLEPPFEEVRREVEDWFLQQGFSREQLCEVGIHFAPIKEVALEFGYEDAVPTGCPPQIPTPIAPSP